MNTLLEKAFKEVEALPQQEQDRLARAILAVVRGIEPPDESEEQEWDNLASSQKSLAWLDLETSDVKKEIAAGKSLGFDPANLVK